MVSFKLVAPQPPDTARLLASDGRCAVEPVTMLTAVDVSDRIVPLTRRRVTENPVNLATQDVLPRPPGSSVSTRNPVARGLQGLDRLPTRVRDAMARAGLVFNTDPLSGHISLSHTYGGRAQVIWNVPAGVSIRGGRVSSDGRVTLLFATARQRRGVGDPASLRYDPIRHEVEIHDVGTAPMVRVFRDPLPLDTERLLAIRAALVAGAERFRGLGKLRTVDPSLIPALRTLFPDGPGSVLAPRTYTELGRPMGANRVGTDLNGFAFVNPGEPLSTVHNELFHSSFYEHQLAAFREARPNATSEEVRAFERERLDRPSHYDDFEWPYGLQVRTNIQPNELGSDAVSIQVDTSEINRLLLMRAERRDPDHQYHLTANYLVGLVRDINAARRSAGAERRAPFADAELTRILNQSSRPLEELDLTDDEVSEVRRSYLELARRVVRHSRDTIVSRHR